MLFGLPPAYWLTVHGFVTIVAVLVYTITAHLLQQRRHPTAAIAWIFFIVLAPYIALPAFLAFGSRKQERPHQAPAPAWPATDTEAPWAIQTSQALGQPAPVPYHDLHLHADGQAALAALWQQIDGARHSIDLCTFIIGRDVVGHTLVARLIAKARAGVQVRLLLDGLGRLMHSHPDLAPLRAAGVQLVLFVPPLHSPLKGRTNLRNHRKMLITDAAHPARHLWCGGRNLASEYFTGARGSLAWHDLSFDLGGPLVLQAHTLFAHDWAFAGGGAPQPASAAAQPGGPPDARQDEDEDSAVRAVPARPIKTGEPAVPAPPEPPAVHALADAFSASGRPTVGAQLIASGPDQADDTVYALLVTAAYRARHSIALVSPYFVPDAALLAALCLAARRGVRVDLVVPRRSNHPVSDLARRRALRTLAGAGASIWATPHMLHAKLVVVDQRLALAGSANLDSRSLFLNYELMVAFHDPQEVAAFQTWFDTEKQLALPLRPTPAGLITDIGEGLVLWMGFQL